MKKSGIALTVVVLAIAIIASIVAVAFLGEESGSKKLRLIVPENWELPVGKSRTVDYAFDSSITNRKLTWSTSSDEIATVDKYGRVTAVSPGKVKIYAKNADGEKGIAKLTVVEASTKHDVEMLKVDYKGNAVKLGANLQKMVTRYANEKALTSAEVPSAIKTAVENGAYNGMREATTKDGAKWVITAYGVLRTDENAENSRDREQRFMGDRYFFDADSSLVKGILADGKNGIWAITPNGVTHIEMVVMSGNDKASYMVAETQSKVMRHGFVDAANLDPATGEYRPWESDNDGLWTSMYAAGELMRYASLKRDGAPASEIEKARKSAYISTEAVLLLSNISMRKGTVEAYVRYQPNGRGDPYPYGSGLANGRYLSHDALEKDGDDTRLLPDVSPAEAFERAYERYLTDGEKIYLLSEEYMKPEHPEDWSNPSTEDGEYEKRVRNLEGFIARTYSVTSEGNLPDGYIHWRFKYDEDGNLVSEGVSIKNEGEGGYLLNGENLRGIIAPTGIDIPKKLWDDLQEAGVIGTDNITDITYKGDTSSDEVIGHMFLYKLAFDILGSEDDELREVIANTMDRFAQHVTDNGYMMVDASGQPGTWSKYNRDFFYNSSQLGGSPLTAAVALSIFKVASYVTGNQRWENEYRMAALDPSYEYARLMGQYSDQCYLYMKVLLDESLADYTGGILTAEKLENGMKLDLGEDSKLTEMLKRLFLNYSDEEMAMLAYYTLFQLETDETLLEYYRKGIDNWWESIRYSENPLWYYIYQLAYPDKEVLDAYGNNIVETAAWSLSRHPIDTHKYLASNANRDDIAEFDLNKIGIQPRTTLSYRIDNGDEEFVLNSILDIVSALTVVPEFEWAVAAPDERALHKYNGSSFGINVDHSPTVMEGSTTYTLPYWLGVYHNLLIDR